MILSQPDLRRSVEAGKVIFTPPLEEKQWGEASVDLRLGFQFTRLKQIDGLRISVADGLGAVADAGFWDTMELPEKNAFGQRSTFCIEPGQFVLAMTYEKITIPNDMIALIEGRSTYARVGLSMHQTAPWIQPGWTGPVVLEIMNHGPLKVDLTPMIDRPCQLTFFQLTSSLEKDQAYGGRPGDAFQGQQHPIQPPKIDKK